MIHARADLPNVAFKLTSIKYSSFFTWSNIALSYLFPTSLHLVSSINQYNPFVVNIFRYSFNISKCWRIEFTRDTTAHIMEALNSSTVTGVLQGDILVLCLFMLYQDHKLWTSTDIIKENGLKLKRQEADDIPLKLWQMQTTQMTKHFSLIHLPHSLNQSSGRHWPQLEHNRIEHIRFKQKGTISTLSDKTLKLVDQFTYLSSNISSTERQAEVWTAIDRLSKIKNYDLFN